MNNGDLDPMLQEYAREAFVDRVRCVVPETARGYGRPFLEFVEFCNLMSPPMRAIPA